MLGKALSRSEGLGDRLCEAVKKKHQRLPSVPLMLRRLPHTEASYLLTETGRENSGDLNWFPVVEHRLSYVHGVVVEGPQEPHVIC